jgi:hypothetical protein
MANACNNNQVPCDGTALADYVWRAMHMNKHNVVTIGRVVLEPLYTRA